MDSSNWYFYVIGGIAFLGYLYWQWQHNKKKIAHFQQVAKQRGWRYRNHDNSALRGFHGDPFDNNGHSRQARHVFSGQHRGRPFCFFEFSYKRTQRNSNGPDRTKTYHYQIVSVGIPAARPMLQITSEHWGTKLMNFVGMRDLQLESVEFNEEYRIKTDEDKFAYDVLHPRTMEWMLQDERAKQTPIRFEGNSLVTWDEGKLKLDEAEPRLDYLCEFVDRVPEFVWKG